MRRFCIKNSPSDSQGEGAGARKQYELFALVPLQKQNDKFVQDLLNQYGNPEIAIRLNDAEQFNLRNFEDVLVCKQKSQDLMQKNKDALLQYVEEIKNLRNLILNDLSTAPAASLTDSTGEKKEGQQIKVGGNVVPSLQGNLAQ